MLQTGQPKIVVDAHGFPCLSWVGLRVGLLPVTKVQVEVILGRPASPGLDCYDAGRAVNPRASWRNPRADHLDTLFLTGLTAEEASRLADLYEPSCRLPTAEEWRLADRCLAGGIDPNLLSRLTADARVHPAARAILGVTTRRSQAVTGRQVGLFDGGLLEWVVGQYGKHGLYGRPPARLFSILLDPQQHDPARPLTDERHVAFGFRLAYGAAARPTARG